MYVCTLALVVAAAVLMWRAAAKTERRRGSMNDDRLEDGRC
jgi:hypothetical protein